MSATPLPGNRIVTRRWLALFLMIVALLPSRAVRAEVILQYFETRWETIERRIPDVFMAGYGALWVPPPSIADSGGFSVGYDVFDRFDFGNPFRPTLYGTDQGYMRMARELEQAGINLYVDIVLNHNGFRDSSSVWNDGVTNFEDAGGYPGFVTRLPNDVDGDFHGRFESGDLNGRLAGLIDIDQSKNHVFTRHPIPGSPNPIPNETPRIENRRFYPDPNLPDGVIGGRFHFNLQNPDAGVPFQENATALLMRWTQWMVEVKHVKGFRIDAVKHMPTWFINNFFDERIKKLGVDPITGNRFTPFSFGENFTGDFGLLAAYTRKDFGNPFGADYNRDALDFPLFFAMRGVFDAGGFGDMRSLEFSSFDGVDGNFNDGTYGVQFAASHDKGSVGNSNVAHGHILTRTGYPLVYYNSKEFGDNRDFPRDGRGDALGNFGSDFIPRAIRIHEAYATGPHVTRWIDADVYIYERPNSLIVGLNDRADAGFDERWVDTAFRNIRLYELSGNSSPNALPFIDIGADGRAPIRVPRGEGFGFVAYGMLPPAATLTIVNASGVIPPDTLPPNPTNADHARQRLTPLQVVTGNTINVRLTTTADILDDNALIKLNYGMDIDGTPGVLITGGRFRGFEAFTKTNQPGNPGAGLYELDINAENLPDGMHYIETVCFHPRLPNEPAVFDIDRAVVWLDRTPPPASLLFPTRTGTNDITSSAYEVVVGVDRTADNVHVIADSATLSDADIIARLSGDTQARRHDRLEWRRVVEDLPAGIIEMAVVVFEPTGSRNIVRFGNIDVNVPQPQVLLGFDDDDNLFATNFRKLPGSINDPAFGRDIVIRVRRDVDFGLPVGGAPDIRTLSWNDGDFSVAIQVDDGPWIDAVNFIAPPQPGNVLYQNDQTAADAFDEFRFRWRGYTRGAHTIRARAQVNDPLFPLANQTLANVFVEFGTPGPAIAITNPPPSPPAAQILTVNNPTEITVAGTINASIAEFARIFLVQDERAVPLKTYESPVPANFSFSVPVGSFAATDVIPPGALPVTNGTFNIRAVASTAPNNGGISSEALSQLRITGVGAPARLPVFATDGDASEMLGANSRVLAVSQADGPGPYADFAGEGSLTELRARFVDNDLFVVLRGEFFGSNTNDLHLLLVDINAGSGQGARNLATQLNDQGDDMRREISLASLVLSDTTLAGLGIDAIVGVTTPNIAAGFTLGTDGLAGAFDNFRYEGGITVAFDANTAAIPAAAGTAIAGSKAIEYRLPLSLLGNPDPTRLRLSAVSVGNTGFPNPNMLPENASQEFIATQTITQMASFQRSPRILINEVSVGDFANPTIDRIELFNPGASAVNLTGWALRMNDSANERRDYLFPSGFSIPAGGYVVVTDQGGTSPPANTATTLYTGFNITWDESRAGAAYLVDAVGLGIDYVDWRNRDDQDPGDAIRSVPYDTAFSGTVRGPVHGLSLGRSAASTDTDQASDWEATGGIDSSIPTFGGQNVSAPAALTVFWTR